MVHKILGSGSLNPAVLVFFNWQKSLGTEGNTAKFLVEESGGVA